MKITPKAQIPPNINLATSDLFLHKRLRASTESRISRRGLLSVHSELLGRNKERIKIS